MKKYFTSQDARNLITAYGLALFPVHGITEAGECTCGSIACTNKGKHPATPDGFKSATNDIDQLLALWAGRQHLNVGIETGAKSNIFVIDIDSAEGERNFKALGDYQPTLSVTTGKGRHLYFKHPGEPVITKRGILEGVDVRGDGGYVCGPGSNHISGSRYEWINALDVIQEAPAFVLDLVVKSRIRIGENPTKILNPSFSPKNILKQGWSIDDARDHLSHISPDCGYDEWIAVGMALQSEGFGVALWDEWSRGGTKYDGTTGQHWKSFKPGAGVSYGTIVHMAKQGGWSPSRVATLPTKALSLPSSPNITARTKEPVFDQITGEVIEDKQEKGAHNPLYYIAAKNIKFNPDDTSLIKNVLGQQELSVIYGESNCGKTFFMTDLAFHVARGLEWRGHRTSQGGVMYAALEGAKGLSGRFEAYCTKNPDTRDMPFALMPCGLDFYSEASNISAFIDLIKSAQDDIGDPKLIVVDTLARALSGGDENSGQDMGRLVHYADLIRFETKAHLSFVHHSGKNKALGARGHSSLRAAVDTEIEISRDDGAEYSTIKFVKQREMEMIEDLAFSLERVVIGVNNFTEEVSSCVVIPAEIGDDAPQRAQTAKERFVYEAIVAAVDQYGKERRPYKDGPLVKSVSYADLAVVLDAMGFGKMYNKDGEDTALAATKDIRIKLRDKNLIGFTGGTVWLLTH